MSNDPRDRGMLYHCLTTLQSQVRSAYRKKGWAFTDPQGIEQCAKEGYVQKLRDQAGEGCHLWGSISVNKVHNSAQILCETMLAVMSQLNSSSGKYKISLLLPPKHCCFRPGERMCPSFLRMKFNVRAGSW